MVLQMATAPGRPHAVTCEDGSKANRQSTRVPRMSRAQTLGHVAEHWTDLPAEPGLLRVVRGAVGQPHAPQLSVPTAILIGQLAPQEGRVVVDVAASRRVTTCSDLCAPRPGDIRLSPELVQAVLVHGYGY
jgi:hypothetical protein